jgi:zinc/manganese transport system substrate-binding protein
LVSNRRARSLISHFRKPAYRSAYIVLAAAPLLIVGALSAVATASALGAARSRPLQVVVAENFWGSIAKQEGGNRAHVTSIIVNPNADPHAYEPTVSDARLMASAQYVVYNGAGYDPWAPKLLAANPVSGRRVLEIGHLLGKKEGDNPHIWYSPSYVERVAARLTADYTRLDRRHGAYFARQHTHFVNVALKAYHAKISLIAHRYRGVKVSATESIFQYLAQALHLNLITPYGFMKAISEGTEPTAHDKAVFDRQIARKEMKVFVFNSQNSTPDTAALEAKAKARHIPVVPITETLSPAGASFQAWQTAQLRVLASALHKATGR